MSKIIRKAYFAWNLEKEKAFLEDMATKGYKLKKASFMKYEFEEIEPMNLSYQFDFRVLNKNKEKDYLSYFEDWEFICRFGSWYYFAKEIEEGHVDSSIFNDNKSKQAMFRRLILFLLLVGFPLYYQVIIFFPNMDYRDTTFPNFYFFFRIITVLLMSIHLLVTLRFVFIYIKLGKSISE